MAKRNSVKPAKKAAAKKPAIKTARVKTKSKPGNDEIVDYHELNRNLEHHEHPLHIRKNYEAAGEKIKP